MDASEIDQILMSAEGTLWQYSHPDQDRVRSARLAVATMAAELTEARAEIAALLGQPEGGLPGWVPTATGEAWVRRLPRSPHDHLLARAGVGVCGWWVYQPDDRRKGTAPTLRDAMRAADRAVGVAS